MFEREDTATICDGVVVRYERRKQGDQLSPEISASRNRVMVQGSLSIHSRGLLLEVMQTLCKAFVQYEQLEPNSRTVWNRMEPLTEDEADRAGNKLLYELALGAAQRRGLVEAEKV